MANANIRWAILGTSFISTVMAEAIQASENSQLYAVGSRSKKTADDFAAKYSIPQTYDDYYALLNDPAIDAVYIGLPNHLHKEWIIHAAAAGKHILCEKPLVISVDEASEVIAAVEKANVFCMEALMYRSHPFIHKLRETIHQKTIGEVKLYSATYTAHIADVANPTAGGCIRNLGCYPISLVRFLANAEPISIQAMGRVNDKTKNDNQASVLLSFADGAMAVVSTADDIKMFWQFDIHGTAGSIKVISNPWLPSKGENKFIIYPRDNNPIEVNVAAEKPLYTYQIDLVNDNIRQRQQGGISLSDSFGNIAVLQAWREQVAS